MEDYRFIVRLACEMLMPLFLNTVASLCDSKIIRHRALLESDYLKSF
jgi:hypothetical protein